MSLPNRAASSGSVVPETNNIFAMPFYDYWNKERHCVICQSSLKMSNSDINHSGVRYNSSSYKMASVMVSAFEEALSKAIRNHQCAHETPDSA